MRSIFLLGGFVGFAVVTVADLWRGLGGDRVLLDASVGCLVTAFLFRWFWSKFVVVFADTLREKRIARAQAEEAEAAAKATPVMGLKTK